MDSASGSAIDWERIHTRLENSHRALEGKFARDEDETRRVLRARAKLLAREPAASAAPKETLQVVRFLLAREQYGIELHHIREVCLLKDLQPLPCTRAFVLGLIHVRGRIVSVIDIKKFFDLPDAGLTDLNRVLILRSGPMEFGILADVILSVEAITVESLQPALSTLTGLRADYVKGVTKEALVLLDAEKMLADKRILVNEG